jgi:uncharacterized protein (TIGR00290 family)
MKVIASWSGGKDSCLASYLAMNQGHQVEYLLNFLSKEYKRCCFHGLEPHLINLQASLIGIPLIQKEVSPDMGEYEREFKQAVADIKTSEIEGMVFGDVYLEEHKTWVDRVCRDLEIQPIEPLWGMAPNQVVRKFIDLGFKAIVVSCKADLFDKEFIGRVMDKNVLEELTRKNICSCGENGEFQTFVIDGPIFKKRIEITKSQTILREGFWKHWFLDIQEYKMI